jgi:hypothetical protein
MHRYLAKSDSSSDNSGKHELISEGSRARLGISSDRIVKDCFVAALHVSTFPVCQAQIRRIC